MERKYKEHLEWLIQRRFALNVHLYLPYTEKQYHFKRLSVSVQSRQFIDKDNGVAFIEFTDLDENDLISLQLAQAGLSERAEVFAVIQHPQGSVLLRDVYVTPERQGSRIIGKLVGDIEEDPIMVKDFLCSKGHSIRSPEPDPFTNRITLITEAEE